jgi:glucosamine--fructose-6-phosphate aminotransferase (isomerizing)
MAPDRHGLLSGMSAQQPLMAREIAEQPDMLQGLVDNGFTEIRSVAEQLVRARPRYVLLAARGTSDHAALYAKYLLEIRRGLPCGLASPSSLTAYGGRPDLRDVLLIAVSQSGGSPDLVQTIEVAKECGATTLAVTNAPDSPLASAADLGINVRAGVESAVAATKTYTAELMALYLLVEAWSRADASDAELLAPVDRIVAAAADLVGRRAEIAQLSDRFRFATQFVLTGRGYDYPTAREAALKLMETSYVAAHAFSGADLMHGPFAQVDRDHPVVAVAPRGVGGEAMRPVLERLEERGADVLLLGDPALAPQASAHFVLPESLSDELHPIVDIIPLQWLSLEVSLARGLDPDSPRGLSKVTKTW